jgi:kynurenine formamidase
LLQIFTQHHYEPLHHMGHPVLTRQGKFAPGRSLMKLKTFAITLALALAILLFAQRHPTVEQPLFTHVLDLTHTISDQVPTFDDTEKFTARTVASLNKQGYFEREVSMPEHFGTHMDAPAHMAAGRWTVDQIPPERLIRPLAVIDVSAKAKNDADYHVSLQDVADWEQANGHLPEGAVVIVRTGWDQRWNSQKAYRNTDAHGTMHFPGYSLDAAKFLVGARNAVALGIDTLSVDAGTEKQFPVHHYCASQSVYHLENVANLDVVPANGALAVVAPPKFQGGSGSPVRVLALVK